MLRTLAEPPSMKYADHSIAGTTVSRRQLLVQPRILLCVHAITCAALLHDSICRTFLKSRISISLLPGLLRPYQSQHDTTPTSNYLEKYSDCC